MGGLGWLITSTADEWLVRQWVSDELWNVAGPLIAPRPQGEVRRREAWPVVAAIVYVLTKGCAWRHVAARVGLQGQVTVHCRFVVWTHAGSVAGTARGCLDQLGSEGLIDWFRATAEAVSVRGIGNGVI